MSSVPSSGTIAYVNASVHQYIADTVMRDILGSIRAGLVFQLKQARAAGARLAP